jgi:hypothetical protein
MDSTDEDKGSGPTNDNVDDYDALFNEFTTLGSNSGKYPIHNLRDAKALGANSLQQPRTQTCNKSSQVRASRGERC